MTTAEQTIPRTDLALPRFFAVILFGLAAFMGLPTVAAVVGSLLSGKWQAALMVASILPIAWAAVWLGRVIWSGRSIPMWFVFAQGGLIAVVPTFGLLMKGEWLGALLAVGFFLPFLMIVWPDMRTTYGTTAKLKAFDDELA